MNDVPAASWSTLARIEAPGSVPYAQVEGRCPIEHPQPDPPPLHWALHPLASLVRDATVPTLVQPLAFRRLRLLHPDAIAHASSALCSASPSTPQDRLLAAYAVAAGLGVPAPGGLPQPPADDDPLADWSPPAAAAYVDHAFSDPAFGDVARGSVPVYSLPWTRFRLPGLDPSVLLPSPPPVPRAVPPSPWAWSSDPVPLTVLSSWLARFARVRSLSPVWGAGSDSTLVTTGTPEAGGLGSLTLWLAPLNVQGLRPGLHHYDPVDHALSAVPGASARPFADRAMRSMGGVEGVPAGILLCAARMGRFLPKYRRMALGALLQSTGAVYAAASVAAAPEGLGVRGLGLAPGDEFVQATGLAPARVALLGALAFGIPS